MRYLMCLVMVCFLTTPASAAFQGPGANAQGGFTGPGSTPPEMTVSKVANLPDDAMVSLTGQIVEKIVGTKDKYTFRDSTGSIIVEIDNKRFMGKDITPENTVRIYGEVDKDFARAPEIDVKKLEVLK